MVASFTEYQITKYVRELYLTKKLSDVTLVCDDGTKILAHKLVLCAGSEVFRILLQQSLERHTHIHLTELDPKFVNLIRQFLYLGKVTSAGEISVSHVAEYLKLKNFSTYYDAKIQKLAKTDKPNCKLDENRAQKIIPDYWETASQYEDFGMVEEEVQNALQNSGQEDIVMHIKDLQNENTTENINRFEDPCLIGNEMMTVSQVSSVILRSLSRKKRKNKSYFCPECPKVCNDSSNLKRHIRACHENEKVACEECGEWFKVDNITRHKKKQS